MSHITNETERLEAKRIITNIVDSMTRAEGEKDVQKELKKQLKEKYGITPAVSGKLAKMVLKANLAEETGTFEVLEELYTQVTR